MDNNGDRVNGVNNEYPCVSTAISSSLFFITLKLESIYKNDISPQWWEECGKEEWEKRVSIYYGYLCEI